MEFGSMNWQPALKLQDIRAIIQRYFENACTEEELSLINYWYSLLTKRCYDCDVAVIPLEQRIWEKVALGN